MPIEQDLRERLDKLEREHTIFHDASAEVARSIHSAILEEGESAREVADVLHGKPFGHPLHPILTDVTIGSWTLGVFFDALAFLTGMRSARRTSDQLITLGTLSAIPTAITGITDFSTIKRDAASYGAAHGMLNGLAFLCFARSTLARMSGHRRNALFYSIAGMTIAIVSAWLGGDMVYRHRIGVNHAVAKKLDKWTIVYPESSLPNTTLTRVEADGAPILLFRQGDEIHAIGAVCSHAGGPLEQGKIVNGICVQCPWHQSVFDLRNGHIVHAPATTPQPRYLARIRNGQIEVRSWMPGAESQASTSLYDTPASEPEVLHEPHDFDKTYHPPSQAEGERELFDGDTADETPVEYKPPRDDGRHPSETPSLYDAPASQPEMLRDERDFDKIDNPPSQAEGERE